VQKKVISFKPITQWNKTLQTTGILIW